MPGTRREFLRRVVYGSAGIYGGAAVSGSCSNREDGLVRFRVMDSEENQPCAARVLLFDANGRQLAPVGHLADLSEDAQEGDVRFQSHRYSYVDGEFAVSPSEYPLKYRVIKGFEYTIEEGEIVGPSDSEVTIPLRRWSRLGDQGWYSGDIHIHHISPQTCSLEMDAEDLNVANILTSDFTTDQAHFEGGLNSISSGDHLIYVNQEFRNHELGHLCLLNLKQLIEPVTEVQPHHHPLHLKVCDETHAQGGYVSWAHFPSWPGVENPLDVAMEKLDGLEILSVLEPRSFPIFMREVVPDWEANDGLRLWYRYLNCGFHLTATAGTDKMTNYVTVGANRVFVRVDGEFTYENWIEGLRNGRTFITNSPVLSLTVNGAEPGSRLNLSSVGQKRIEISTRAESQLPYDRLEVVCNGRVIADESPTGPLHTAEISLEHPLTESCWIAARAVEDLAPHRASNFDFTTVHATEGPLVGNYYGTRRPETVFAHTSPVYISRDDKPIRSWDDAQYYVRYMDQSIAWMEKEAKFAAPADRQAALEAFRVGKEIYQRRAREAESRRISRGSGSGVRE